MFKKTKDYLNIFVSALIIQLVWSEMDQNI